MKHNILTETAFYRALESKEEIENIRDMYDEFISCVIKVCKAGDTASAYIALSYTEVELNACKVSPQVKTYVDKALSFIKEMRNMLETTVGKGITANPAIPELPQIEWTGQTVDLVELMYALKETGSINNGEMPISQMSEAFFQIFGRKTQRDYTRYYVCIKERDADFSYTYFIDKMRRKLNEKIKTDIKKSLSK